MSASTAEDFDDTNFSERESAYDRVAMIQVFAQVYQSDIKLVLPANT